MIEYLTNVSRPHVVAEDITNINFRKMRDEGLKKVIFNKWNTLIRHGEVTFPHPTFKDTLKECKELFGEKNIFMIANLHES